jgi:hypothetical protein
MMVAPHSEKILKTTIVFCALLATCATACADVPKTYPVKPSPAITETKLEPALQFDVYAAPHSYDRGEEHTAHLLAPADAFAIHHDTTKGTP